MTDPGPIVLVTDLGPVRVITLNRPAARNALSIQLTAALYAALVAAEAADTVGAIVLTGTDPAFCAGIDLKEAARDGERYFDRYRETPCVEQVARMATPVIGAVNGPTFTGGLELALGCDFLVASERAAFADTHAGVGIVPGGGMTAWLPRLVGQAKARRMSYTGEIVEAQEALRIGLVTEVVAHDDLLPRAVGLATATTSSPPGVVATIKRVYAESEESALRPSLDIERAASRARTLDRHTLDERRRSQTALNRERLLRRDDSM